MTDNDFYDKLANEGEYVDKLYAKTITNMIFSGCKSLVFASK